MTLYVALLRGINVGGKNLIKMPDLVRCFEELGYKNVSTYIQSGNVIFRAGEADSDRLTNAIEETLTKTFHYQSMVVLRSYEELKNVVEQAPDGFGSQPDLYRYDVIFLKKPLTATSAMTYVTTKEGVDLAFAGNGVLYFSRLTSRATQSRLSRVVSLPVYQSMTIRNWNTTTKLLELMGKAGQ